MHSFHSYMACPNKLDVSGLQVLMSHTRQVSTSPSPALQPWYALCLVLEDCLCQADQASCLHLPVIALITAWRHQLNWGCKLVYAHVRKC